MLNALQQSFLSVQQAFSALNLVLNTSKTKVMWFGKKNAPLPTGVIAKSALERLDVLYHSAILFATNAPYRTHHCTLYSSVNWSSLYTRCKTHWLMPIYKTLLGLTPSDLRYLLQPSSSTYNTRSASHILLKVPKAHRSLGCSSFQFTAASDWNKQQTLKLDSFISMSSF